MEIKTEILTSRQQLEVYDKLISNATLVAVDTETDGVSRFRKLIGISFSLSENDGVYVPLRIWSKDKNDLVCPWANVKIVHDYLIKWLSNKSKKWILHNAVFDIIAIQNELGINIEDSVYSDTMLLSHTVIDEAGPHGLKPLAVKHLGPDADSAQEDLKQSVIEAGGIWKKGEKEIWKGDYKIVGIYAGHDTALTFGLHNRFYPEIKKQNMENLWNLEVLPLIKVMVELNSAGIKIDVPYFEKLKVELENNITSLEKDIYEAIRHQVSDYEFTKVLDKLTITPRSVIGKELVAKGLTFTESLIEEELLDKKTGEKKVKQKKQYTPVNITQFKKEICDFYCQKEEIKQIFSLNSVEDKAFLLFDVLELQSIKTTKAGKKAVDAKTIKALVEEIEESDADEASGILKKLLLRAKEIKILNTYTVPILENHINGRLYPQFSQTGTSTGRYSSGHPINFQTLPAGDLRIKKGFIPDQGECFVDADYSSLEVRVFADVSNEPELRKVFEKDEDIYSFAHIYLFEDFQYSAKEGDKNFLKDLNPPARKKAKVYVLGLTYRMQVYKLAKELNISVDEAQDIMDRYFTKFPNLKTYQETSVKNMKYKHFVTNKMGRKKRAKLIPYLQSKFRIDVSDKREIMRCYNSALRDPDFQYILQSLGQRNKKPKDPKDFAYLVNNEFNSSTNFPIQGLAASLLNAASIDLVNALRKEKLDAKLVLSVHDQLTLRSKRHCASRVAQLLQQSMERNHVAKMMSVPLKAEPQIIEHDLSEVKK